MSLSVTHRIPRPDGTCPRCGDVMRTVMNTTQAGSYIECGDIPRVERLRLELHVAEDRVLSIRREIELLERLKGE